MTTHAHIIDAIREMEKRGVEPTMDDFEAMAALLIDEEEQGTTDTAGSLPALPTNT